MNEAEVKKLLGRKIRKFRKRLGLTQFELGEKIELDQRQIAYIEGGNSFPSLKTLLKFANVYDCTLKELFDYDEFLDIEDLKRINREKILKFNDKKSDLCGNIIDLVNKFCSEY